MSKRAKGFAYARYFVCCVAAILILAATSGASDGQKSKKTKSTDASAQPVPMPPLPDTDQIENNIGEMLAAFQLGNVEEMHKYYADNVTFVSSDYGPPLIGWQNYVPLYQRERASFQAMQLNRRNTLIVTHGDVAWASYQWEFDSTFNGRPYSVRGQTTLVFNKVGENWLIVHNHTSEISPTPTSAQQQPTPPAVAQPRP